MSIKKKLFGVVRGGMTLISPKLNTKVCYRVKFKRKLDLDHPETLNEKILWLKFNTYWENELVKQCADKLRVRDYITEHGFGYLLNELIAVYYKAEDIDWDMLPDRFALKLNVGCGCNLIVSDKNKLDKRKAEATIKKWLKRNFWLGWSEMQYKGVKPCILVEKYLGSDSGDLPEDYKFYCLNGEAKYVMVCVDREIGKHAAFYYFNRQWEMMPYSADYFANPDRIVPKPEHIDEAFEAAEKLSKEFPFVRTDLYIVDGKVIFGELTFTPSAGLDQGRLPETDKVLGEQLRLPIDK
ncbi:MAG: glycosyl transferase [Clostridia bacterium]|nr:glycosyl transferase [Clostridia bacterium]